MKKKEKRKRNRTHTLTRGTTSNDTLNTKGIANTCWYDKVDLSTFSGSGNKLFIKLLRQVDLLYICFILICIFFLFNQRYYSLIYDYLSYFTVIWSSTCATNLNKTFLEQNALLGQYRTGTLVHPLHLLFVQLDILDIFKINYFHIAKFMFTYYQQLIPSNFENIFVTSSQIHNYNTIAL